VSSDGLISYALVSPIHDSATVSASKDPDKGRNPPGVIATVSCRSASLVLSLSEDVQELVELNLDRERAARNERSCEFEPQNERKDGCRALMMRCRPTARCSGCWNSESIEQKCPGSR